MPVICAQTDSDIRQCWAVMSHLRPHLSEEQFLAAVKTQFMEGYRLAFIKEGSNVVAVAGFRIVHNLVWGRFCYVDDLVTDEQARSRGHGGTLLDWLKEFARAERCTRLELDSGVQRFSAHRFYLRHQMFISCHHFSLEL